MKANPKTAIDILWQQEIDEHDRLVAEIYLNDLKMQCLSLAYLGYPCLCWYPLVNQFVFDMMSEKGYRFNLINETYYK